MMFQVLECSVVGGFVNGVGLPAVPADVEPGAGEDACGVGVIVSAGSGAVVKSGRPLKKSEIPNDVYEAELFRLQTEFVKLQEWGAAYGRASFAASWPTNTSPTSATPASPTTVRRQAISAR